MCNNTNNNIEPNLKTRLCFTTIISSVCCMPNDCCIRLQHSTVQYSNPITRSFGSLSLPPDYDTLAISPVIPPPLLCYECVCLVALTLSMIIYILLQYNCCKFFHRIKRLNTDLIYYYNYYWTIFSAHPVPSVMNQNSNFVSFSLLSFSCMLLSCLSLFVSLFVCACVGIANGCSHHHRPPGPRKRCPTKRDSSRTQWRTHRSRPRKQVRRELALC